MIIASINVSPVREVVRGGRLVRTGIFKASIAGPVRLGERGFEGDDQADRKHHGHPTQRSIRIGRRSCRD